ncbi:MAG: RNA ligase partner protein [Candidatus Omnitrophica bacterium]|nr:RNA ligase partner protein [Candidatus Omnitrophota bacterium]
MREPLKVVIDTNIFINPDAYRYFGATSEQAFNNFLDMLERTKSLACFIPPSVYEELSKFFEGGLPSKKTVLIDKKPPSSYQNSIPALLFYEFIEEMRLRINKGLRIAEKYARKGLKREESEEALIKSLREEHRVGMREGIIDSKEDFDLILLAKELNGHLATADNGLIKWAQKLGIPALSAQELKELLERVV